MGLIYPCVAPGKIRKNVNLPKRLMTGPRRSEARGRRFSAAAVGQEPRWRTRESCSPRPASSRRPPAASTKRSGSTAGWARRETWRAPAGGSASSGCAAGTGQPREGPGLAEPHRHRAGHRAPRRPGADQPAGGRPALHQHPHGRVPPAQGVPQARHQVTGRPDPDSPGEPRAGTARTRGLTRQLPDACWSLFVVGQGLTMSRVRHARSSGRQCRTGCLLDLPGR
jgi:hypothetical protein